ncbi:MAG: hypothetical protein NVSMB2_26840 [Chloroflexota bacterium]
MTCDTSRFPLLRTRAVSLTLAGVLLLLGSALVGLSPVSAVLVALVFSLAIGTLFSVAEPLVLRWSGCRAPNRSEAERLSVHTGSAGVPVLVHDSADPFVIQCPGRIVLSVALLDALEDRALLGYLTQASYSGFRAALIGEAIVWSCIWPIALGRVLTGVASRFGCVLAMVVGYALVLPMLLCPDGFVRWAGRVFTPLVLAWLLLMLGAGGYPGLAGAALVSVLSYPVALAVLRWEWRRVEKAADRATIDRGLGAHLLEAIETLAWVHTAPPRGVLGLLFHSGTPAATRADIVRRHLSRTS